MYKTDLNAFLSKNPFSRPLTQGLFYREKMRAIHRVAPDIAAQSILEVGGGRSGLTTMLYPQANVVNLDLNPDYAQAQCNQLKQVQFVCGDATQLPFGDRTFDMVTMFDVLEHIPDDRKAASEALRVLKPGGFLIVSSPNENWRFPYYGMMKLICPSDETVMNDWGHVRRGYALTDLELLIGLSTINYATFINPATIVCHDIAFSNLPKAARELLCVAVSPLTLYGYINHHPHALGTETVSLWQKPFE